MVFIMYIEIIMLGVVYQFDYGNYYIRYIKICCGWNCSIVVEWVYKVLDLVFVIILNVMLNI